MCFFALLSEIFGLCTLFGIKNKLESKSLCVDELVIPEWSSLLISAATLPPVIMNVAMDAS